MENTRLTAQEVQDILIARDSNILLTEDHKYYYGFKELSGITGMLKQFISPHKLDGIDPEVLENARKRGAGIHEALDGLIKNKCSDEMNVDFINEALKIYDKLAELNMIAIASEYIVSDFENFASPIDVIGYNETGEIFILDLKCTSVLDYDFVRWQTNIYRLFFEKMTGLRVTGLYALHYHNQECDIVELSMIEDQHINYMLDCWTDLEEFHNPIDEKINEDVMLNKTLQVCKSIEALENEKKQLDAEFEKLKTGLLELMKANGVKKFENDLIRLTYKEKSTRVSLDSKRLKEEQPEVFENYKKETEVKESILIKIK
jgi:hypothetical protein